MSSLTELAAWLDTHINLEARAGHVTDLSLDRMQGLAARLGDPQSCYPAIHITGTNGKGSTTHLVSKLLAGQGLSVGTYSSPHVEAVNERISVNGEPISEGELAEALGVLRQVEDAAIADGEAPYSWFELLTAAAFWHFASEAVEVAVVEVGKLGRYDATNIISADIAAVSNISEDHTDKQGKWREAIAWEKAGIITPDSTLVLGEWEESQALEEIFAAEKPRRTLQVGREARLVSNELAVGGRLLEIETPRASYRDLFLSLNGAHQGENATLALLIAETFFDAALPEEVVGEVFGSAAVRARLEVVGQEPLVILDGAHNPRGAQVSAEAVCHDFSVTGDTVLLVGMTQGHNHELSLKLLLDILSTENPIHVICTTAPSPRGIPAAELAGIVKELGYDSKTCPDLEAALQQAVTLAGADGLVFVTGSLYVAGSARQLYTHNRSHLQI